MLITAVAWNNIKVIKSGKISRGGGRRHLAHKEETRNADNVLLGRLKGRDHLGDLCIDRRTVLI
jgi:hypothetical protein